MNSNQINTAELTTFDVDPEGRYVRLHVRDCGGEPASCVLPVDCAIQLMMTLPGMVQKALQNLNGNDSVRVVHALDDYRVELGDLSASGVPQFILTLATTGGFAVSFSATRNELASLSEAICDDLVPLKSQQDASRRLS